MAIIEKEKAIDVVRQMVEELSYKSDCDRYGNCYGVIPPSRDEIINKINEIIQYLNKKEMEK